MSYLLNEIIVLLIMLEAFSVEGLEWLAAAMFLSGSCLALAEGCFAFAMLACVVRPPCVDVEDIKAELMERYPVLATNQGQRHAELRCFDGTALFCASGALKRGFEKVGKTLQEFDCRAQPSEHSKQVHPSGLAFFWT